MTVEPRPEDQSGPPTERVPVPSPGVPEETVEALGVAPEGSDRPEPSGYDQGDGLDPGESATLAVEAEAPPQTSPLPSGAQEVGDLVYLPFALSIGDGFKFGCGFTMALTIALAIAVLIVAALFLVASLMGVNLPGVAPLRP